MKTAGFARRAGSELFIFVPELRKAIPEQIKLHRFIHVDADQFTRPIPKVLRQALSVRDGLVEVHRCHVKTVPLPDRKNLVKFPAVQTAGHDCRDELGKFHYVDGSPRYFIRDPAQDGSRGIEIASNLYRVNGRVRLTSSVKAKIIHRRIHNPGDFRLSGSSLALADQLFVAGRG